MWLPEPIYEFLPYLYLVIGVLLVGGAIYIGIGTAGMPYYFALGLFSILGGAIIHTRRSIARKHKAKSEPTETS